MAANGVVFRQRFVDDVDVGSGLLDDQPGQRLDGELPRVAQVDRSRVVVLQGHQSNQALHQVGDVAERPCLVAPTVDGEGLRGQGLHDEVAHHPPVVGHHPRPVGVEDAGHPDGEVVLTPVVEEEGLGATLALVVAGARADRVDVAPVRLALGLDCGIAVDLAGRRLEDADSQPLGQTQHVDGAVDAGLGRLDGVELVVDGRGRAGQVVDLVHLDVQGEGDIVANQLEVGVLQEVGDVVFANRCRSCPRTALRGPGPAGSRRGGSRGIRSHPSPTFACATGPPSFAPSARLTH